MEHYSAYQKIKLNGNLRPVTEVLQDEKVIDSVKNFLREWISHEDYVVVKTSGSTGVPKEIRIQKSAMLVSAFQTNSFFKLHEYCRTLLSLPADFIAGKMMLVRAMAGNYNIVSVEPSSDPLKEIPYEVKFDFAPFTPMQVHEMLSNENSAGKFENIQTVIIGGGEISFSLEQMIRRLKNNCYSTYGMTETITHIAVRKLNGADARPWYQTFKGIRINVDERNCLVIEAPHISKEPIITNDVVEMEDLDKFIWKGRYDNVINTGGVKVYPEEIEKKISDSILRRFIIGSIPDGKLGEKVVLVIEGDKLDQYTESMLKNHLSETLSRFELPREIFYLPQLPVTDNGKLMRKSILEKISI